LIHCRVNQGGMLEFTVKAQHAETADQLLS